MGNRSEVYVIKIQKKLQYGSILGFSKDFCLMLLVLPNIARLEYSYGANKQKIKKLDPCNCNVRANKNAGKAFSMQRYLYRCKGLIFLFSFVHLNFLFSLVSCMKSIVIEKRISIKLLTYG